MPQQTMPPSTLAPPIFISKQVALHPKIMAQDVLKMCFQSAFGAEHLIANIDKAQQYFDDEFERITPIPPSIATPLWEFLTPQVCRVNMAVWKALGLPPQWLFNVFVDGANAPNNPHIPPQNPLYHYQQEEAAIDRGALFFAYVKAWGNYILDNPDKLSFTFAQFETTLAQYMKACNGKLQAVHHSPEYKTAETPAYRVVSGLHLRVLPILVKAFKQFGPSKGVIAIDGPAGSGKSCLAYILERILPQAHTIPADHFFLPPGERTPQRLAEAGGNIHYQRFKEEVADKLLANAITYQVFDCQQNAFTHTQTIPTTGWVIIEGSYSHHPHMGLLNALKVFSDFPDSTALDSAASDSTASATEAPAPLEESTQMRRITRRNPHMAQRFKDQWIPMEEKYFAHFKIQENAHLRV